MNARVFEDERANVWHTIRAEVTQSPARSRAAGIRFRKNG